MLSKIKKTNRKGVSIMVGYVLLVTLAIVMGIIAYNWMKTYIPRDITECPDGVSVFIKEAAFNFSDSKLVLVLKNNGRFNAVGYLIYGANSSGQALPTIDLSSYLDENSGGKKLGNSVSFFLGAGNSFAPNTEATHTFDIPSGIGEIYSISITPMRIEEDNNKEKIVSCGNARANQVVGEPGVECVPEGISVTCGTWVCGNKVNNCGDLVSCGTCTSPNVCNSTGQCVPPAQCTDTCATYGYNCGTWDICGVPTACGSLGGACSSGFECNVTGQCVSICGNGIINTGEACDDGNTASGDGCSSTCSVELGYSCVGQPSDCNINVDSCPSYCVSLDYGNGFCTNSAGNCDSSGGTYESGGNQWCTGGSQADTCCCTRG